MIFRRSADTGGRPAARIRGGAVGLAFFLALAPAAALAHSYIEVTEPADGSSLSRPPEKVRVTYTEPVEAGVTRLILLDAAGKAVPGTRQEAEGRLVLVLHLPPDLAPGAYTLRSETLGADGHPTVDEIRFSVTGPARNPPDAGAAPGKAASPGGANPAAGSAPANAGSPGGAAPGTASGPAGGEAAEARSELGTDFLVLAVSLLALGAAVAAILLAGRRRGSGGPRKEGSGGTSGSGPGAPPVGGDSPGPGGG